MIYLTSDTHFGHRNIIKYCNRPYKNVWEMNYKLIENWNSVVGPNDVVYHLGDFSFLPEKQTKEVLDCLNGKIKKMIRGNHDRGQNFYGDKLELIGVEAVIEIHDKQLLNLSHYPETFKDQAGIHLCGHIHTCWRSWEPQPGTLIYNVGIDVWDYKPITLDNIIADMADPQNRRMGVWQDPHGD